jgi:hypothetical protein
MNYQRHAWHVGATQRICIGVAWAVLGAGLANLPNLDCWRLAQVIFTRGNA